ncbi:MAG: hypothetical protein M1820_004746 [Bogoriella megaspora]|nr:MAG: hypothetical protein M1820_004746 [Bogoriella megaspora]
MNQDVSQPSANQPGAVSINPSSSFDLQADPSLKTQVPPRTSSRGSRDQKLSREPSAEHRSGSTSQTAANTGTTQPNPPRSGENEDRTNLSGATVGEKDSVGKRSRSITGRRRTGSKSSSKRGGQQLATTTTTEKVPERPQSSTHQTGNADAKQQTKPSLFRRLLCCAGSQEANPLEPEDAAQPARKPNKLRQTRPPQPLPKDVKQDASAAESSTADSKEPLDEKAGGSATVPVEKTTAAEAKGQDYSTPEDAAVDGTNAETQSEPAGANRSQPSSQVKTSGTSQQTQQPPQLDTSAETLRGQSQLQAPQLSVTEATPVVGQEDEIISDRTPEQARTDYELESTDSGPHVPISSNDVATAEETNTSKRDSSPPKIPLPPPPPLEERQKVAPLPVSAPSEPSVTPELPEKRWLLPPIKPELKGKKCLVLDLDETLVHSSFKILHQADFTIPVEIEGQYHNVYVIKRPGVDAFMKRVGELYEIVVFTASVAKYGDPVLDNLDIHGVVHHRLFRESCYNHQGNYVKDLSQVGRDLQKTIIIDNSPTSYIFHPQHAVPISSWFSDAHDNELLDLIPVLEDLAGTNVDDVSLVLDVAL